MGQHITGASNQGGLTVDFPFHPLIEKSPLPRGLPVVRAQVAPFTGRGLKHQPRGLGRFFRRRKQWVFKITRTSPRTSGHLTIDNCLFTMPIMILSIQHRGLRRFYDNDDRRGLNQEHVEKIRRILQALDLATRPEDLDLPGFRLHSLKGDLAGYWSITVRANWRIIFRFDGQDVADVDLRDYH